MQQEGYLNAQKVKFKIFNYPVLWLPSLRVNLNSIFDNPIRYRFRWGGRQGPRFGLTYEIFSWNRWKTFVRFDYRLTRGPGGGIEMRYRSLDRKTEFQSINYLAKDSSILRPHEKIRYRLEGFFRKFLHKDKTSVLVTYDKISDQDMPNSYYDRDFDFDTSERTQLRIRREEKKWIANFYTRIRINSFQTVKQELPSFEASFKPFDINHTGFIFENWAKASYLNFQYSKHLPHIHSYSSSRFQYSYTLYRPITFGRFCTLTPEAGIMTTFYDNNPKHEPQWLIISKLGIDFQTQLYRYYNAVKHVIEPYLSYRYYSRPTSSAHDHYIFDLSDGWQQLNYASFGVRSAFYTKYQSNHIARILSTDIYCFVFFDPLKTCQSIPRVYGKLTFLPFSTVKHTLDMAWN